MERALFKSKRNPCLKAIMVNMLILVLLVLATSMWSMYIGYGVCGI